MLNLDLNKKQVLPIVFESGVTISVLPPTKKIVDRMTELTSVTDLAPIYDLLSQTLSRNTEKIEITREFLENKIDVFDIKLIFAEYTKFIKEITADPNF